jgi:hypothetical protein
MGWVQVKGTIRQGYGVASGKGGDPRFPQGTLALQMPFFRAQGLDLAAYFSGTINLSIAPHQYVIQQAAYTFKQVKWSPNAPAEDFSFFDCQVLVHPDQPLRGLIYYPHPETKPEHFQPPDSLEIMTPFIGGLRPGDELIIEVDSQQIQIVG